MTIGRRVRVFGRVQGVFYRQWAINQARPLALSGWVRNCPDGSVEARLFGEVEAVVQMIEAMRGGPPQARVEDVMVEEIEAEEVAGFTVRH
jgi:acylphosphatase